MYLRDYRAVDYLTHRDDWDGKVLVVTGTSMGGQQSLCVAGLHPKITHVIVEEPSGCDLCAGLHGRQEGYPSFPINDAKVMAVAPYVDAVNFAMATSERPRLVAMGFVDNVAPPTGIWTAFNLIRGPKEAAPMPEAPHNNTGNPGAAASLLHAQFCVARRVSQRRTGGSAKKRGQSLTATRLAEPKDRVLEKVVLYVGVEDLVPVAHVDIKHPVLRIRPDNGNVAFGQKGSSFLPARG